MKTFLAWFAAVLALIGATAVTVGAMLDVTGFRAWLAQTLPYNSLFFLVSFCVVGVAYTVVACLKYNTLMSTGVRNRRNYLVDVVFGLVGFVIASASFAVIPSPDAQGLVSAHHMWLLAVLQETMSLCGVFFPAISAITFTLAVPMVGVSIVYSEHALEAKYRGKQKRSGNKVMLSLRRLCGVA